MNNWEFSTNQSTFLRSEWSNVEEHPEMKHCYQKCAQLSGEKAIRLVNKTLSVKNEKRIHFQLYQWARCRSFESPVIQYITHSPPSVYIKVTGSTERTNQRTKLPAKIKQNKYQTECVTSLCKSAAHPVFLCALSKRGGGKFKSAPCFWPFENLKLFSIFQFQVFK